MKFEFQNLGTVKKTTLDLRPLTVIVGPNNTSKTYLAYCVHGMARALQRWAEKGFDEYDLSTESDHPGDVGLRVIVDETRRALQSIASEFTEGLAEYFQDTHGGLFRNSKVSVETDTKEVLACLRRIGAETNGENVTVDGGPTLCKLVDELLGAALTLPAERNAFIITYKMLSTRRYRVLRDRERALGFEKHKDGSERERTLLREQGDIRYPAPIEDFLDFLTDVELRAARPRNDAVSAFGKLANLIETHLQGGHRTRYEATKLGGSELTVTVSDDLRLDLYNASSSIKQIAPFLLYLRYRAEPNQTLIIDEPEMNLHPEGQAKLLEALGMLANLGVRVLLTTHSPYFMAHLNNLIAADPTSPARKKRQAKHLYMGDPAAFLSPGDVSAYEMRPDGLCSLSDPEYGIRWDTLSDVSSELQRRYFAIVEEPKSHAKANGQASKGRAKASGEEPRRRATPK